MSLFFNSWDAILRTLAAGTLAYIGLVVILRVSGKRTLSKWNAFDFIITIALGSTLASILLTKDVSLIQGILALGLLIGLQFVVTFLSVRLDKISQLVKARPRLLLLRGILQTQAMQEERVTEGEILAALRTEGIARVEDAGAVVLETDGSFSVLPELGRGGKSTLADVRGTESLAALD